MKTFSISKEQNSLIFITRVLKEKSIVWTKKFEIETFVITIDDME